MQSVQRNNKSHATHDMLLVSTSSDTSLILSLHFHFQLSHNKLQSSVLSKHVSDNNHKTTKAFITTVMSCFCHAIVTLLSRFCHVSVTFQSRFGHGSVTFAPYNQSLSRHKEHASNVPSSLLPNKMTLLKFLFFPTKRTPALEMPIPILQFLTINSTQAVVHKYFLSDSNLSHRTKNRTHR